MQRNIEQRRTEINCGFWLGQSATKAFQMLNDANDESAVSDVTVGCNPTASDFGD